MIKMNKENMIDWSSETKRNALWANQHMDALNAKYGDGYVLILNRQVIAWAKFATWLPLNNYEDAICCELSGQYNKKAEHKCKNVFYQKIRQFMYCAKNKRNYSSKWEK